MYKRSSASLRFDPSSLRFDPYRREWNLCRDSGLTDSQHDVEGGGAAVSAWDSRGTSTHPLPLQNPFSLEFPDEEGDGFREEEEAEIAAVVKDLKSAVDPVVPASAQPQALAGERGASAAKRSADKAVHNATERRYRTGVNDSITSLCSAAVAVNPSLSRPCPRPSNFNRKGGKLTFSEDVLHAAFDDVQSLRVELDLKTRECLALRAQLEARSGHD